MSKLVALLALSSLAVLFTSLNAVPANALVSGHQARSPAHAHDALAKRVLKRSNPNKLKRQNQRCRTRPSNSTSTAAASVSTSSFVQSSTPAPAPAAAPSSSPAENAAPAPSPAPASSGSSGPLPKVGLSWPNGNDPSMPQYKTSHTKIMYTWTESCPSDAAKNGFNCVPMLWGNAGDKISAFNAAVSQLSPNYVLGFNECNEPGQSNMSPQDAIKAWMDNIQPLKAKGWTLVGPVMSSNPNGFTWYQTFMQLCAEQGCTVDIIPIHYYDVSAQGFIDYAEKWRDAFNKPIWATEYACQNFVNFNAQCSEGDTWNFHSTIAKYADSQDWLQVIIPFGWMHDMVGVNADNQLMSPSGAPTALGSTYIDDSWQ